jgi:acetyl esterase/lipase
MKRISISILLLLSFMAMQAQTTFKVNLSSDGDAEMTAYLPATPSGRAVVDCPGGGYTHLSMQNEGSDWVNYFNNQGIAFFVLKYRMPAGDRTKPLTDARKAIEMVRDSASKWNINPNDVGIMGFSAGGHLASATATMSPVASRPNFQILFYPVITCGKVGHVGCMDNFLGTDKDSDNILREFSTDRQVRSHITPPTIIMTASDDQTVDPYDNCMAFCNAMHKHGIACTMFVYPTGGHGFGFKTSFKYHDQMLENLTSWLQNLPSPSRNALKVVCIGNSITDGYGIKMADENGYPAQLQTMLGNAYIVKNCGVSARTLLRKGNLPIWNERLWQDAQDFCPEIAVIKLGTNDSKPMNWKYGKEYPKDLQDMIDSLKVVNKNVKIYLALPLPCWMVSTPGDQNLIRDEVIKNEVIPMIKKVAKKNKLETIDLYTPFSTRKDLIQGDGIHPVKDGATLMAKIIKDAIAR